MSKALQRPEMPRQKPREPVEWPGGPARMCRNCEHFDGGGLDKQGQPNRNRGDCHNGISGRFTTTADDKCDRGFYPCTTRWPLKAGAGGIRG